MQTLRINDIKIGRRHRKDMGDIAGLAESIRERGLLQAIGITPDHRLIFGRRRIEACKTLGMEEIRVDVIDVDDLLYAERDENTERKEFAPTEAVAIGRECEERERKKAKERQKDGGKKAGRGRAKQEEIGSEESSEPISQTENGQSRDKVASAVGMSHDTYRKGKAVVEAALHEPDIFGDLPELMDEKNVNAAFREMKKRQKGADEKPPKEVTATPVIEKIATLLDKWLPRLDREERSIVGTYLRSRAKELF